jgi:hypothetical protein
LKNFDEALDCVGADISLKVRFVRSLGRIRLYAGIGPHYQNQDNLLRREATGLSAGRGHSAIAGRNWESNERDFGTQI